MSLEEFFDVHTFVWTLINFVLFMLVLKFLILDPLLKTMRARQEKIDNFDKNCRVKAEEALKNKALIEDEAAKRLSKLKTDADAAYEKALQKHREDMQIAEAEHETLLKKSENEASAERAAIMAAVEKELPAMTESFLGRIISKDDNYAC